MTALLRRTFAAVDLSSRNLSLEAALSAWRRAESIRDHWLDQAFSPEPADRALAEHTLTRIYARLGRLRPVFVWVRSPEAALPLVRGTLPTHADLQRWVCGPVPRGRPPLASDLAAEVSRLRSRLEEAYEKPSFDPKPPKRKKDEPWPVLEPRAALEFGVPFREVLRQGVRLHLEARLPRLGMLGEVRSLPVCWYGRHDVHWVAHYDVVRRLGLAHYPPADDRELDDWAALARSCGWWWPDEHRCVVVDPG